jgi:hypothetical protein
LFYRFSVLIIFVLHCYVVLFWGTEFQL